MISISTPFKCRHLKMILVRRTHFSNDNGGEEFFLLPCHYIVALEEFKPPEEVFSLCHLMFWERSRVQRNKHRTAATESGCPGHFYRKMELT